MLTVCAMFMPSLLCPTYLPDPLFVYRILDISSHNPIVYLPDAPAVKRLRCDFESYQRFVTIAIDICSPSGFFLFLCIASTPELYESCFVGFLILVSSGPALVPTVLSCHYVSPAWVVLTSLVFYPEWGTQIFWSPRFDSTKAPARRFLWDTRSQVSR